MLKIVTSEARFKFYTLIVHPSRSREAVTSLLLGDAAEMTTGSTPKQSVPTNAQKDPAGKSTRGKKGKV